MSRHLRQKTDSFTSLTCALLAGVLQQTLNSYFHLYPGDLNGGAQCIIGHKYFDFLFARFRDSGKAY